jgi:hypothetical protein
VVNAWAGLKVATQPAIKSPAFSSVVLWLHIFDIEPPSGAAAPPKSSYNTLQLRTLKTAYEIESKT